MRDFRRAAASSWHVKVALRPVGDRGNSQHDEREPGRGSEAPNLGHQLKSLCEHGPGVLRVRSSVGPDRWFAVVIWRSSTDFIHSPVDKPGRERGNRWITLYINGGHKKVAISACAAIPMRVLMGYRNRIPVIEEVEATRRPHRQGRFGVIQGMSFSQGLFGGSRCYR
jgi:hypothetical protein